MWELASARLGQCPYFIDNGKLVITGFRYMLLRLKLCLGNIYVVVESERDWTGETRARVSHVEVAVLT